MLYDSEIRCAGFFLNVFSLCQLKIFIMLSDFTQMIALRHSIAFQCNVPFVFAQFWLA